MPPSTTVLLSPTQIGARQLVFVILVSKSKFHLFFLFLFVPVSPFSHFLFSLCSILSFFPLFQSPHFLFYPCSSFPFFSFSFFPLFYTLLFLLVLVSPFPHFLFSPCSQFSLFQSLLFTLNFAVWSRVNQRSDLTGNQLMHFRIISHNLLQLQKYHYTLQHFLWITTVH